MPRILSVFFLLITLIALLFFLFYYITYTQKTTLLSPLAEAGKSIAVFFHPSLENVVMSKLADAKGEYGIVVKDLTTSETFSYNQDEIYESASLYKLWIMVVVFNQINNGWLKEDTLLKENTVALYEKFDLATESAEFVQEEIAMTVSEALEQMVTISRNDAALLLSARIRLSTVSEFLKDEGFEKSTIGTPPKTTAWEIALFFEKLYKGEFVSKEYSEKMLSLLARQKLNDRIPKYLPKNSTVAHKTGELEEYKHDAGIVYSPKKDYIIVLLSKTDDPEEAAERMARISKAVYDYYNK